jgi:hypothetical protein
VLQWVAANFVTSHLSPKKNKNKSYTCFNLSHWVLSSGIMRVDSYTCLLYYLHVGCHKLCQLTSFCIPLAIWLPCIATVNDITYLTSSLHAVVESMHSLSSRPDSLPLALLARPWPSPFGHSSTKNFHGLLVHDMSSNRSLVSRRLALIDGSKSGVWVSTICFLNLC